MTAPTTGPRIRYTFTAADGAKEVRTHPARDADHAAELYDAAIIPAAPASLLDNILRETRGCTKVFAA